MKVEKLVEMLRAQQSYLCDRAADEIERLQKEVKMAVSAEEYNRKYHQEMARHGVSRDEAVRATNVACGYGDSTALQHPVTDEPPPPEAQPKD